MSSTTTTSSVPSANEGSQLKYLALITLIIPFGAVCYVLYICYVRRRRRAQMYAIKLSGERCVGEPDNQNINQALAAADSNVDKSNNWCNGGNYNPRSLSSPNQNISQQATWPANELAKSNSDSESTFDPLGQEAEVQHERRARRRLRITSDANTLNDKSRTTDIAETSGDKIYSNARSINLLTSVDRDKENNNELAMSNTNFRQYLPVRLSERDNAQNSKYANLDDDDDDDDEEYEQRVSNTNLKNNVFGPIYATSLFQIEQTNGMLERFNNSNQAITTSQWQQQSNADNNTSASYKECSTDPISYYDPAMYNATTEILLNMNSTSDFANNYSTFSPIITNKSDVALNESLNHCNNGNSNRIKSKLNEQSLETTSVKAQLPSATLNTIECIKPNAVNNTQLDNAECKLENDNKTSTVTSKTVLMNSHKRTLSDALRRKEENAFENVLTQVSSQTLSSKELQRWKRDNHSLHEELAEMEATNMLENQNENENVEVVNNCDYYKSERTICVNNDNDSKKNRSTKTKQAMIMKSQMRLTFT